MAGLDPQNGAEVNHTVGIVLRQFTDIREGIGHYQNWLLPTDLKIEPYNMTPEDETLIKSAVADLATVLEGIDMTFIRRLTGVWT